ncbi:MAG: glycosyltransferase family 39 protein [Nitrospirae bacterium]|nr:glycosyltransferase family 39 protein [Nitrospirota bacterium]
MTDNKRIIIIMAFAALLRLWNIGNPGLVADESVAIPETTIFMHTGETVSANWYTPTGRHYFFASGVAVLGNNPYGWRIMFVLSGLISIYLLHLIGRELLGSGKEAAMAALMMSTEPLHVFYSRTVFAEIPAMMCFLAGIYFLVLYYRGRTYALLLSGSCLGLALSTKWYFIPSTVMLAVYTLYRDVKGGQKFVPAAGYILACFFLIPLSVNILSFSPWFGRGYTAVDFIEWQINAYLEQQSLTLLDFPQNVLTTLSPSSASWFIKPVIFGERLFGDGLRSWYNLYVSNFPIWMLAFPSFGYILMSARKSGRYEILAIPALFLSLYCQFLLVKRPLFFYSALQALPFVYLGVSYLLCRVTARMKKNELFFYVISGLLILWGFYLVPLYTGIPVSEGLYAPLLALGNIRY